MSKGIIIVADYREETDFTLNEIVESLQVDKDFINQLIEFEVIQPTRDLRFDTQAVKRIHQARRLQRDLELNLAGIALVLDLLDEIEDLREKNALIERLLFR